MSCDNLCDEALKF